MGRVRDAAGSYAGLLALLAVLTVISAALMLLLPRYPQTAGSWNVPAAT
ncbi:MAG: hypothetical protein KIT09_24385 [Bryobacteraceae bacterium]|nr:hypothetical protein [Bryobacteraceae bacterium]